MSATTSCRRLRFVSVSFRNCLPCEQMISAIQRAAQHLGSARSAHAVVAREDAAFLVALEVDFAFGRRVVQSRAQDPYDAIRADFADLLLLDQPFESRPAVAKLSKVLPPATGPQPAFFSASELA